MNNYIFIHYKRLRSSIDDSKLGMWGNGRIVCKTLRRCGLWIPLARALLNHGHGRAFTPRVEMTLFGPSFKTIKIANTVSNAMCRYCLHSFHDWAEGKALAVNCTLSLSLSSSYHCPLSFTM